MGEPIGVDTDYVLTVTVRVYGGGSPDEAAEALRNYRGTFDLSGDREVEILSVSASGGPPSDGGRLT